MSHINFAKKIGERCVSDLFLPYELSLDDALAGHFFGLFHAHDIEQGRRDVAQGFAALELCADVFIACDDERNEVGRMRGARRAALEHHYFGIAVVGGDYCRAAALPNRFNDFFEAFVYRLDRGDGGAEHARMPDHVAVCEVEYQYVLAALDLCDRFIRDLVRAHFGLEIVGRDLRAGDEHTCLVLVGLLDAAVEEERYVRVFFGLGDSRLCEAVVGEVFAERVFEVTRRERRFDILERDVVLRHADVGHFFMTAHAVEAVERRRCDSAGDLARTVGAEVIEYHRVAVVNAFVLAYDDGLDELVHRACRVACGYRAVGGAEMLALRGEHYVVAARNAFPAVVAVHIVIPSDDCRDPADAYLGYFILELGNKASARVGRNVASVGYAVNAHVLDAAFFSEREQCVQMRIHAVNAAVAQ